ncbi:MAG: MFS transporter [Bacillota bacterium]|nr:MFS transporter [Bacillota bacterium]
MSAAPEDSGAGLSISPCPAGGPASASFLSRADQPGEATAQVEGTPGEGDGLGAFLVAGGHCVVDFYNELLPPLMPFLVASLGLSMTMAGGLVSAVAVSASLLQPLFGWLVDRTGWQWLLPLSAAWIAVLMSTVGLVKDYRLLILLVGLAGLGSALYHPLGSVRITSLAPRHRGLAMSAYSALGNFGEAVVPLVAVPLVLSRGLKATWLLALPGVTFALVMWLLRGRGGRAGAPLGAGPNGAQAFAFHPAELRGRWRQVLLLDASLILRSWVHVSLLTFVPLYLVESGQTPLVASRLLFLFMAAGAAAIFVAGHLSDLYGYRPVMIGGLLGTVAAFLGFLVAPSPALAVVFLVAAGALILAPLPVAIVAGQRLIPHRAGMASGMMMGFAWGLGGLGATLTGRLADLWGISAALRTVIWLLVPAALFVLTLPGEEGRGCRA